MAILIHTMHFDYNNDDLIILKYFTENPNIFNDFSFHLELKCKQNHQNKLVTENCKHLNVPTFVDVEIQQYF